MEAHYVEAGSMSIFWTQNRALKTTSLARVLVLGGTRWVRALLYGGTQIGLGGTRWVSSSLRGTQIGFGGTRWDPVGPSPSLRGTLHPVWVLQC